MKKKLAIFNLLSVILVIAVNYISQMFEFNGTTIGEISNRYENLFTPAGYAFAIWGVIFLGLLAYGIYQIKCAFSNKKDHTFIEQTGYWFILANILNCCWVFVFVYDYTGLSVLVMFGILISLIKIILNTNMERWDAPIGTIAFIWWPICLYSGWISVATIANISAYLAKLNWSGGLFTETAWTIIMIVIATALNLIMIWKRNMREFAAVGVWALIAIYVRHSGILDSIANTALVCAGLLSIVIIVHCLKNWKTNPLQKLKQRFS